MDYYAAVKQFHDAFRHPAPAKPTLTPYDDPAQNERLHILRVALIQEEFDELKEGLKNQDIVEIADALADLAVVVTGAAVCYGIDLNEVFAEVNRSNMSKLDANGQPIYRADGKILKSELYSPPDIVTIIEKQLKQDVLSTGN